MKRTKDLVNEMSEFESFILSEIKQVVERPKIKYYTEEDMNDYANYRLLIKKSLSPKEWFEQFKNK